MRFKSAQQRRAVMARIYQGGSRGPNPIVGSIHFRKGTVQRGLMAGGGAVSVLAGLGAYTDSRSIARAASATARLAAESRKFWRGKGGGPQVYMTTNRWTGEIMRKTRQPYTSEAGKGFIQATRKGSRALGQAARFRVLSKVGLGLGIAGGTLAAAGIARSYYRSYRHQNSRRQ